MQRCAVTHQPQRDALQQCTHSNTNPRSQYSTLLTALETAAGIHAPKTRTLRRAYDTATILQILAGPTRIAAHMPTSAALPATITPQPRAQTHTMRQFEAPPCTMARQRHGACHPGPKQRTPTCHASRIANSLTHSIQTHKPRTPAGRPTRTAATTARTNITAHAPPHVCYTQQGTQLRAPHTPPTENHTQSHTRPPRHTHCTAGRLPSVDGMLPESWLLFKYNTLQET
jgi:hypothetical protein